MNKVMVAVILTWLFIILGWVLIIMSFVFRYMFDLNLFWVLSGSPYYICNNIVIEQGVKLTNEPGEEVLFNDSYSLIVDGALNATGFKCY